MGSRRKVEAAHQMMIMAARKKDSGQCNNREAAMLLIGEGTSDIQKMIIGRRILEDYQLS